jgi:hypothetical protein
VLAPIVVNVPIMLLPESISRCGSIGTPLFRLRGRSSGLMDFRYPTPTSAAALMRQVLADSARE